jgi:lipoprotein-anchoring transpeptidase ErfK/SrfK
LSRRKAQETTMKAASKLSEATSRAALAVMALMLVAALPGTAQSRNQEAIPVERQIIVSIPDRKLAVLQDDEVLAVFSVAVGAQVSPSPVGEFEIVTRLAKPTYYHPGVIIPPGKDNPLGPRWIGLNKKGYGIHGTNVPGSIGKAASHGCIRLRNRDIERLFELVHKGDLVEIRSDRDQQTAEIFGGEHEPATAVAQAQAPIATGGGQ